MNTMSPASPLPPLNPFQGFVLAWSRYAEFQGRSSRVEFWSFQIISFFIMIFLSAFFVFPGVIFQLVALIPSFSVWVRRLHDVGRSGWWIFWGLGAPIIAFVLVAVVRVLMLAVRVMAGVSNVSSAISDADAVDILDAISGAAPNAANLVGDATIFTILATVLPLAMSSIFIITIAMCFVEGDPETNKYGPNPKLNPTAPNNPIQTFSPDEQSAYYPSK